MTNDEAISCVVESLRSQCSEGTLHDVEDWMRRGSPQEDEIEPVARMYRIAAQAMLVACLAGEEV